METYNATIVIEYAAESAEDAATQLTEATDLLSDAYYSVVVTKSARVSP